MNFKSRMNLSKFMYLLILLVALVSFSLGCRSYSNTQNAGNHVDDYLKRIEAHGFSGAVLIAEKDEILLSKGYGLENTQPALLFSEKTLFPIASITKSFTAVAILMLEQSGKLDLSDPIEKYFENVPEEKRKITIHHLLSHTSGLVRDISRSAREQIVSQILKSELRHPIGERFDYSNAGYQLLGSIIERIAGETYEDFLKKNMFNPLGLNCFFENDTAIWKRLPLAFDEHQKYTVIEKNYRTESQIGQGGIICCITDLYRWFSALCSGELVDLKRVQKAMSSKIQIDTDGNYTDYGYGFYMNFKVPEDPIILHGGDIFGYHSEMRWHKNRKRLIIVFTNKELYGLGVHKRIIASNINKLLNGNKVTMPDKMIRLLGNEENRYVGTYLIDENNAFHVEYRNDRLKIGAEGQTAINALSVHNQDQIEYIRDRNELTAKIVTALFNNQTDTLQKLLSKSVYDFFVPYWIEELRGFQENYGLLKSVSLKGSLAYPWQEKYVRCFSYYAFENKVVDISYIWQNDNLNETLTESGKRYPVIMTLVKIRENLFAVFDLVTSRGNTIELSDDKLIILSQHKTIIAKKI